MTFDKNKVYTALNADEVKIGSKGYFADKLETLREFVSEDDDPRTLVEVLGEEYAQRFDEGGNPWNLFYLVEEPEEDKYRPYKNNVELLEDFKNRMPESDFWVGGKDSGNEYLITGFIKDDANTYCVLIGTCFVSLEVLFELYTYLDGTPCGKKIE